MDNFWDKRYSDESYVYGIQPNLFFKEHLSKLKAGKVLLPAEGEGRNAVYAAQCGWQVEAFDQSKEGQTKALKLANECDVTINYSISDYQSIEYPLSYFDTIGLIYAHILYEVKLTYYRRLLPYLKTGGYIIFEGFGKQQIGFQQKDKSAGGPRDIGMLFSEDELSDIFNGMKIILLEESTTFLSEGIGHNGESSVVRMIAQKTQVNI